MKIETGTRRYRQKGRRKAKEGRRKRTQNKESKKKKEKRQKGHWQLYSHESYLPDTPTARPAMNARQ
jgi:hypothetical protein